MKRVRLVKVVVSPVFLIDDGETLIETAQEPIAIPAADWPTYSSVRFPAEVEAWETDLNREQGDD